MDSKAQRREEIASGSDWKHRILLITVNLKNYTLVVYVF